MVGFNKRNSNLPRVEEKSNARTSTLLQYFPKLVTSVFPSFVFLVIAMFSITEDFVLYFRQVLRDFVAVWSCIGAA